MSEKISATSKDGSKFIPPQTWAEVLPSVYDVDGNVFASDIPNLIDASGAIRVKFRHVTGDFSVTGSGLKTLSGCPQTVGGNFHCAWNALQDLRGGPTYVGGNYECHCNQLRTLNGVPTKILGDFTCANNELTTLKGAPEIVKGRFVCAKNNLHTLEGGPQIVGGAFYCDHNQLSNLNGAPYEVGGEFSCTHNRLRNLDGYPKITRGSIICSYNQITDLEFVRESDDIVNYGIGENPGIARSPQEGGGYIISAKVLPGCWQLIEDGKLNNAPISIDWQGFKRPLCQYTHWIPRNATVKHLNLSSLQKQKLDDLLSRHDVDFLEEYKENKTKLRDNSSLEIDF